jgi:hypothetical protein
MFLHNQFGAKNWKYALLFLDLNKLFQRCLKYVGLRKYQLQQQQQQEERTM